MVDLGFVLKNYFIKGLRFQTILVLSVFWNSRRSISGKNWRWMKMWSILLRGRLKV